MKKLKIFFRDFTLLLKNMSTFNLLISFIASSMMLAIIIYHSYLFEMFLKWLNYFKDNNSDPDSGSECESYYYSDSSSEIGMPEFATNANAGMHNILAYNMGVFENIKIQTRMMHDIVDMINKTNANIFQVSSFIMHMHTLDTIQQTYMSNLLQEILKTLQENNINATGVNTPNVNNILSNIQNQPLHSMLNLNNAEIDLINLGTLQWQDLYSANYRLSHDSGPVIGRLLYNNYNLPDVHIHNLGLRLYKFRTEIFNKDIFAIANNSLLSEYTQQFKEMNESLTNFRIRFSTLQSIDPLTTMNMYQERSREITGILQDLDNSSTSNIPPIDNMDTWKTSYKEATIITAIIAIIGLSTVGLATFTNVPLDAIDIIAN